MPWYLGSGKKIQPAKGEDIKTGFPYLLQLIDKLPELKVIVLVGKKVQRIKKDLQKYWHKPIIDCYHPSPLFVNNKIPTNKRLIIESLRLVSQILNYH